MINENYLYYALLVVFRASNTTGQMVVAVFYLFISLIGTLLMRLNASTLSCCQAYQ